MRTRSWILCLFLALFGLLYGCQNEQDKNGLETKKDTLTIYTTVYPLEDFTKKIGGDVVEVNSIYPPGAEAHTFEPTTKTIQQVADADAFIYIGQGMEPFAEKLKEALKNEPVRFLAAADSIDLLESSHEEHGEDDEHAAPKGNGDEHEHHGDKDPHVWLDPIRSVKMAEQIRDLLIELKPEQKETFTANFNALKEKLEVLDQTFQQTVQSAPNKDILVAHAAYGYWEERYGLRQRSVSGLTPTNEPSQKQLVALIDWAKRHHIRYVLFERNIPAKTAEMIQHEIDAKALYLHNLETLTDEDRKQNRDYFNLMEQNIETIEQALR
ncbi:metal ABC transporter substrate-binding protein [Geobacillus thermodenitrificans]|jgi:zinc transport system substrate-binding protein|uniref:metal ABC transporter substrate-binding protein n=1 Tax=Geobacillus TaxID=129337 RepID=UPI000C058639|nr:MULTISPECIES: metal ABC transporter substrate-binding protein [Geobacillus]ATO38091.1 adhesin [Geobacillus thermodenitrificans]NNU86479.1 adhesin [Geobacillus sp. MR]